MKALIAVISDLSTDMRVQKHAMLLAGEGFEVTLIGRKTGSLVPLSLPGVETLRIRVPFRKGPGMYILFNFFLFLRLLFRRFDLCLACDLDTLVPCYMVTRLSGRRLVYDAHEYFTGQHGLAERRVIHAIWKWAERLILPKVRHMITVSGSIADLYHREYGVSPVIIRNVAPSVTHLKPHDRSALGASEEDLLVVFQGSGINEGRGARELIKAMTMLERIRLVIIGSGDIIDSLRSSARESGAAGRILFLPRMPWEEMMRYTMCCDAGLSLDTDTCENQRYSLPNKLFDYIAAGIPVIVSPLPEVASLIGRYGCGVVIGEVTPGAVAIALERLRDDRGLLFSLREKTAEARSELNWEKEKIKEQVFFRSVIDLKS
ncbi:MAG: glycosyltransferase [Bacteroidales bacterium]|nr:glycosyltransferase [Bacteroidales bacterium]